jgi:L-alanine-DL-glutamate epimerase-like enolase superfamily enzyme
VLSSYFLGSKFAITINQIQGEEMGKINRVEIHVFRFNVPDMGLGDHQASGVANVIYKQGDSFAAERLAVRILCDDGAQGEYVTHWVGTPSTLGQALMLAPRLLGRDPEQRELIYDDLKREVRAYDHMGHGLLDIALWDLAGKMYNTSVSRLLGGFRERLPTYASTYHGQTEPGGLDSPEAFADYALACKEAGFAGFKIHGWHEGDARKEARNVLGVRAAVGDEWPLMLDPACQLRTYLDALYVGRACDEANFFWYEDPYRDGGVSAIGHQRLREQLKTPILVSEHVRGLEQKAAFMIHGGCDMIHADPEYDMGITGAMKIAHLCEALGLDLQLHACGPAHRAVMSALRNTHFYEMALVGPGMANMVPPVYLDGYSDQPEDLDADGCVPVPDGPGLGVVYDWDFIEANRTALHRFE